MAVRWGIISTGKISSDFANAVSLLPKCDHVVVAVAARIEGSAQAFAERYHVPIYYEGYENLAKDPNVEVAYVGTLNRQHYETVMMLLDHGKHVLCEKPLAMNERQAERLIAHAKAKKLFLMEGIWSRFFPSYQYVKKRINDGDLGEIQEVNVSFGFPHSETERLL